MSHGRTPHCLLFHFCRLFFSLLIALPFPSVVSRADVMFSSVTCEQFGQTPLLVCCYEGHLAVALRLVFHGADPTAQDNGVSISSPCIGWG